MAQLKPALYERDQSSNQVHLANYFGIRFVWVSAKFGTCTVVSVKGTLVEDKMRRFKGECPHFIFSKCLIYTHNGASAKFSTNPHETDNSVQLPYTKEKESEYTGGNLRCT